MGEESEPFLKALASKVVIVPSWAPSHPAPDVLKRLINSRFPPAERFVYVTDMRDAARIVIGQRATALGGPPGHVVVRVRGRRETVLGHRDLESGRERHRLVGSGAVHGGEGQLIRDKARSFSSVLRSTVTSQ